MLKIKKPVSVLLAAVMLFALCSCDDAKETSKSSDGYHIKWMDCGIFDNVSKMPQESLKDNFAAAVNADWAAKQKEDFTYPISCFGEAMRTVVKNKRAMIEDGSFNNKNIELVRTADGLFNDWTYRDSLGVEPLKKYLGYIDDIKTLDDVTSYMTDNAKNPFAVSLVEMEFFDNDALDEGLGLSLKRPGLILDKEDYYVNMTDDGFKRKELVENRTTYLLRRCGYSDKQIKDLIKRCFRFETGLIHVAVTDIMEYTTVKSKDEVIKLAGNYPLKELFDHYSIKDCDRIMGLIKYVDNLENIYKQSNVEDMKAYFKVRLALDSMLYLDKDAYEYYFDSKVDRTNPFALRTQNDQDYYFFQMLGQTSMTAAVDQAYIDYYFDEGTYNESKDFVRQIKEKYKILIRENKNLSEESKKAVLDKLDKLGENIMRPSNKADFTGVELKTKEQGGSFIDAMCELSRIKYEHIGQIVQMKTDRTFWDIYDNSTSTTQTGACYVPMRNAIYIYMGILIEPFYSPDAPIEQKLGTFVSVLGHEISHAFDSHNINTDAEGKDKKVVTDKEKEIFSNTSYKIQEHFEGYVPFKGCPAYGTSPDITGEVIADAEGLKVSLMIGKDQKDFDMDLFFRSYAVLWKFIESKERQMNRVTGDEHPLPYLRINYTMLQFDEFVQTYGIKPGDGMYIDPSQRILIW